MDLTITLTAAEPDTPGVTVTASPEWLQLGGRVGLVMAAEWLQPGSPTADVVPVPYDALNFLGPNFQPIVVPTGRDGVLRVVVCAVQVLVSYEIADQPEGTIYLTQSGQARVRRTAASADALLVPELLLGEAPVLAEAEAQAYYLADGQLEDALARLNLRYLRLPYQQQYGLLEVYERALLYHAGVGSLFDQKRYLDAAATLSAARYLLATNGQNPDDAGPLLGGYFPAI